MEKETFNEKELKEHYLTEADKTFEQTEKDFIEKYNSVVKFEELSKYIMSALKENKTYRDILLSVKEHNLREFQTLSSIKERLEKGGEIDEIILFIQEKIDKWENPVDILKFIKNMLEEGKEFDKAVLYIKKILEKYCSHSFLREGVKYDDSFLDNIQQDIERLVQCYIWRLKQKSKEKRDDYTFTCMDEAKIKQIATAELINWVGEEIGAGKEKAEILKSTEDKFGEILPSANFSAIIDFCLEEKNKKNPNASDLEKKR